MTATESHQKISNSCNIPYWVQVYVGPPCCFGCRPHRRQWAAPTEMSFVSETKISGWTPENINIFSPGDLRSPSHGRRLSPQCSQATQMIRCEPRPRWGWGWGRGRRPQCRPPQLPPSLLTPRVLLGSSQHLLQRSELRAKTLKSVGKCRLCFFNRKTTALGHSSY